MGPGGRQLTGEEEGLQVRDAQCGHRRRRVTGVGSRFPGGISVRTCVFARTSICVYLLSSVHRRAEKKRCLVATGIPHAQILVSSNFTPR